ncbi:MAG: hypothetical protein IIB04_07335 [Acidobacteria bacterium]|nr:hypothetical protein [Acidobacteriota bacterium]
MRSNAVAEALIERTTEEQAKAISRGLDTVARQLRALQEVDQEQLIFEVEDLRSIGQELGATLDEVAKIDNELFNLREAETGLISETESLIDFQASLNITAAEVDRVSSELILVQGRMNLSAAELNELNLVYETEMESVAVSIGLIASQMEALVEVQKNSPSF